MQTKLLVLILLTLPFTFLNTSTAAQKQVEENSANTVKSKKLDGRAVILAEYLSRFNSPLQYHAQDFIEASDAYGLDWKMLPAIAGVESTFGKRIPGGYNAWGWGVYGTQAIYFKSWRDGIFTIAAGLRKNYLNKGLQDPYSINRVYAASPYWGGKVNYFMNDLDRFSAPYLAREQKISKLYSTHTIAAISGQLSPEGI